MAIQKGIIKLEGTIDGINFYFRKGKAVARKAGGGFDGKAIKTKDSMVRVRENGSEFGAVSKIKRLFRVSVEEALVAFSDGTLHGRMMKLLQNIKVLDAVSERGKRSVYEGLKTTLGKQLFSDFLFTPKQDVFSVFIGLPVVLNFGNNCLFNELKVTKSSFKKGASHLQINYFVVDYCFDLMEFKKYNCAHLMINKLELPTALPDFEIANLPPTYQLRMAFLSVQFFQNVGEELVILKEEGQTGLRCLEVYSL